MEARAAAAAAGRPVKGILKNRSGSGGGSGQGLAEPQEPQPPPPPGARPEAQSSAESRGEEHGKKSAKWDEMNILATYHPAGKDYGLMKIDEPSTPYRSMKDEDVGSDAEDGPVAAADVLAKRLAAAVEGKGPKILAKQDDSSEEEEDEVDLTPEELEKKRQFEMKRKMHYNEAKNIKFARQLIAKEMHGEAAEEEEEEEEDEEDEEMQDAGRMSTESVPAASDPLENIAHSLEEVCSGL